MSGDQHCKRPSSDCGDESLAARKKKCYQASVALLDTHGHERKRVMEDYYSTLKRLDGLEADREQLEKRYKKLCWYNEKLYEYMTEQCSICDPHQMVDDQGTFATSGTGCNIIPDGFTMEKRDLTYNNMCEYEINDAQRRESFSREMSHFEHIEPGNSGSAEGDHNSNQIPTRANNWGFLSAKPNVKCNTNGVLL